MNATTRMLLCSAIGTTRSAASRASPSGITTSRAAAVDLPRHTVYPGYPDDMTQADDPPADRVGYVEFVYDGAGDLYQTIAKELPTSSSVIAIDQYDRDSRRNIEAEYQGLGLAAIDNNTPKIQSPFRTHTNTGTGLGDVGQTRLASMTYPVHSLTNAAAPALTFTYGSSYWPMTFCRD